MAASKVVAQTYGYVQLAPPPNSPITWGGKVCTYLSRYPETGVAGGKYLIVYLEPDTYFHYNLLLPALYISLPFSSLPSSQLSSFNFTVDYNIDSLGQILNDFLLSYYSSSYSFRSLFWIVKTLNLLLFSLWLDFLGDYTYMKLTGWPSHHSEIHELFLQRFIGSKGRSTNQITSKDNGETERRRDRRRDRQIFRHTPRCSISSTKSSRHHLATATFALFQLCFEPTLAHHEIHQPPFSSATCYLRQADKARRWNRPWPPK